MASTVRSTPVCRNTTSSADLARISLISAFVMTLILCESFLAFSCTAFARTWTFPVVTDAVAPTAPPEIVSHAKMAPDKAAVRDIRIRFSFILYTPLLSSYINELPHSLRNTRNEPLRDNVKFNMYCYITTPLYNTPNMYT